VKPLTKVKKICKILQKKSKVMSLFTKKKANVKKMFTDNFKAKDLKKE
jgi:hypothetical protein